MNLFRLIYSGKKSKIDALILIFRVLSTFDNDWEFFSVFDSRTDFFWQRWNTIEIGPLDEVDQIAEQLFSISIRQLFNTIKTGIVI